jgi:hypothetical protein
MPVARLHPRRKSRRWNAVIQKRPLPSNRDNLQSIANGIAGRLEPGSAFFLLTQVGSNPVNYISNGHRDDVIKMMREFLDRQPLQQPEAN